MTYDELVGLIGYYPIITTDQWNAMSTEERLAWLAKAVKKRDDNWKNVLVRCNAAWEAKLKAASVKTEPGASPLPVIVFAAVAVSCLLSFAIGVAAR